MSVNTNQYLIYGVNPGFQFVKEWEAKHSPDQDEGFYSKFEEYIDDSPYNTKIGGKDGLFCIFDGMNGQLLTIGKVIAKSEDDEPCLASDGPITIPFISHSEQARLAQQIKEVFDCEGPMAWHLVTLYR